MGKVHWSPSRLKEAQKCLRWYYYYYLDQDKKEIEKNPYAALGDLFHSLMVQLYKGSAPDLFFKSAESFAGAAYGQWYQLFVNTGQTKDGKKISWKSKNQPHVLAQEAKKIAKVVYETYSKRPWPVLKCLEHKVELELENISLLGITDAILPYVKEKGLVIIDYKTDRREPWQGRLDLDPQFGLYLFLVGAEISHNPSFRKDINFPDEEAKKLSPENYFLSPNIVLQIDLLRYGTSLRVTKSKEDIEAILSSIQDRQQQIKAKNFIRTRGDHCFTCQRRVRCEQELIEKIEPVLPGHNQLKLFSSSRQPKPSKPLQKHLRFKYK